VKNFFKIFSFIILFSGLSLSIQAAEINKLSKKLDPQSELLLKETLGHTKIEVMVGSFLGPLITLPGMFFLGSPLKIFELVIN